MSVDFGFFNSINDDRLYNADNISNFFYKLISDGVFASPSNAMQVQQNTGMMVAVTPGWGMINAKYVHITTPENIILDAADILHPRIDRIILRLDYVQRMIVCVKKTGTAAANPSPPALARTEGVIWELSLAQIYVAPNATAVTQENITDERPDTSLCGFITGMIDQIDTTNLFAQFSAAFWNWFNGVKDEVLRNTLVRRYTRRVLSTENPQSAFAVGITQYNSSLDILNVYVNGIRLQPEIDYTVSGTTVTLTDALDVVGTPVDFEVLKSIDGSDAESITVLVDQLSAQLNALTNRFATQVGNYTLWAGTETEYTAIDPKDANTLYHVTEDAT